MLREINFDGIVGPSHNYAGLSRGNLAATRSAGAASHPRAAALQGIAKMRTAMQLGLAQGFFLPQARPDHRWLGQLAINYADAAPHLQAQAVSASSMWAANAATVSPAPDTEDGRCHLTIANLATMPHRSHEWRETAAQLKVAFADPCFAVRQPIPAPFGDEGAANHMRLTRQHGEAGVEVFVYGTAGGRFPARQSQDASEAIARRHGVKQALFVEQAPEAIAAGAFHNDVVAVANETVLFAHERAFANKQPFLDDLAGRLPELQLIEVPEDRVSLTDAIATYLFNAQLVTLPDGAMALIVPAETRAHDGVWSYLQELIGGNGPIRRVEVVDVRESMANGGGPACLRLRVVADPALVDPRFMADETTLSHLEHVVERYWPEEIRYEDIGDRALIEQIEAARRVLFETFDLVGLIDS
jgi:succinylarginine dihydrolase